MKHLPYKGKTGLISRIRGRLRRSGAKADKPRDTAYLRTDDEEFNQVTRNIRWTLEQLQTYHSQQFGGSHPLHCLRPPFFEPEKDICQAIELLESDLGKVWLSQQDTRSTKAKKGNHKNATT